MNEHINGRRARLVDMVEEAQFALYMHDLMYKEGEQLLEENERLKNDPEFAVPESLDRRCLTLINREFSRSKRKRAAKTASKLITRVAVVFLAVSLAFAVPFMAVEAFRIKTLNFIVNMFDTHCSITLTPSSTGELTGKPELTWIPEGFELDEEHSDEDSMRYEHENGTYFRYSIDTTKTNFNIDTENADFVKEISLSGTKATLSVKGKLTSLVWFDYQNNVSCMISAEGLNHNVVKKIAENVK